MHLTAFKRLAQFFFSVTTLPVFPLRLFFRQWTVMCFIRPGPQSSQAGRWRRNIFNQCQVGTILLIWKGQHCRSSIIQSLGILQSLTSTRSQEAIIMDFMVHIGRVDVIKIHFLVAPVQLLLWKAVDFSCLLQFRFTEFLNLSHILFVRYFGRLSNNRVHKRKSDFHSSYSTHLSDIPVFHSSLCWYCIIVIRLGPQGFPPAPP